MNVVSKNLYAAITVFLLVLTWLSGFSSKPRFISGETSLPPEWESAAKRLAPQNLHIVPSAHGACRLEGVDDSGKVRWHAVFSAWLNPRPIGYAGPIDLVAGVDESGKITGVSILRHNETPSFAAGISEPWFLDQFVGKTANDLLEPGKDIDGITRATITTEAVCEALRCGSAVIASHEQQPAPVVDFTGNVYNKAAIKPLAALSLAILAALLQSYITPALAALIIVFSIGFTYPQFLSLAHLRFLKGASPSIPLIVFLTTVGIFVIATPRGYCRFLCPCGRLQDLLSRLQLYLSKYISYFTIFADSCGCHFRSAGRALLWSTLLFSLLIDQFPLERIEVFSALFLRSFGWWGTLAAFATIIGAFLMPRFYCRLLCPFNPLFADIETIKQCLSRQFARKKANE